MTKKDTNCECKDEEKEKVRRTGKKAKSKDTCKPSYPPIKRENKSECCQQVKEQLRKAKEAEKKRSGRAKRRRSDSDSRRGGAKKRGGEPCECSAERRSRGGAGRLSEARAPREDTGDGKVVVKKKDKQSGNKCLNCCKGSAKDEDHEDCYMKCTQTMGVGRLGPPSEGGPLERGPPMWPPCWGPPVCPPPPWGLQLGQQVGPPPGDDDGPAAAAAVRSCKKRSKCDNSTFDRDESRGRKRDDLKSSNKGEGKEFCDNLAPVCKYEKPERAERNRRYGARRPAPPSDKRFRKKFVSGPCCPREERDCAYLDDAGGRRGWGRGWGRGGDDSDSYDSYGDDSSGSGRRNRRRRRRGHGGGRSGADGRQHGRGRYGGGRYGGGTDHDEEGHWHGDKFHKECVPEKPNFQPDLEAARGPIHKPISATDSHHSATSEPSHKNATSAK